ncbi:MAG: hypothetical protein IT335_03270 [Thermomicrobiales bacterium]|nr:hypothetical protein [Thermomicrobiales bacterium]
MSCTSAQVAPQHFPKQHVPPQGTLPPEHVTGGTVVLVVVVVPPGRRVVVVVVVVLVVVVVEVVVVGQSHMSALQMQSSNGQSSSLQHPSIGSKQLKVSPSLVVCSQHWRPSGQQ